MNIGGKIKEKREALGISQRELARRIEMSGQMISKIESGLSTPSIETINKIAAILSVPVSSLLEDSLEVSFSYKLICAIEETYNETYTGSPAQDIFQTLSNDLDINYEDFDNYQQKKTTCTLDEKGVPTYNQVTNINLDRTKELSLPDIKKLLAYYKELNADKFRSFCSNETNDNDEVKEIVNLLLSSCTPKQEHNFANNGEYYRCLELRINELAANTNTSISKASLDNIISNVNSLIEFELYKLKNNSSKNP